MTNKKKKNDDDKSRTLWKFPRIASHTSFIFKAKIFLFTFFFCLFHFFFIENQNQVQYMNCSLINQYDRSYVEQMYVIMICYFFIYNKWILIDLCEPRMCWIFFLFYFLFIGGNIELCSWKIKNWSTCVCLVTQGRSKW